MSCEKHREKIMDVLVAVGEVIPSELSAHCQACPACRDFYEQNSILVRSMDASLAAMVNREMPHSLLPGVRARLDELTVPRTAWTLRWSLTAALAVVVFLGLSLGYVRLQPRSRPNSLENGAASAGAMGNPEPALQPLIELPTASRRGSRNGTRSRDLPPAPSTAAPEVIVLKEERQAFARLVAGIPRERDVALALTQPAPSTSDGPVEISPLQIESVEVKPLETAQADGGAN
jgi:hypothetical protein